MDSIQLIEKIVQRLENRMDKQDTKIDKIMESVNVISTQRIYCVKECDARYVLKKMLEHDVKELFEKFAIKHVDWFNRIINTLTIS